MKYCKYYQAAGYNQYFQDLTFAHVCMYDELFHITTIILQERVDHASISSFTPIKLTAIVHPDRILGELPLC